jgi:hypothetical protein
MSVELLLSERKNFFLMTWKEKFCRLDFPIAASSRTAVKRTTKQYFNCLSATAMVFGEGNFENKLLRLSVECRRELKAKHAEQTALANMIYGVSLV